MSVFNVFFCQRKKEQKGFHNVRAVAKAIRIFTYVIINSCIVSLFVKGISSVTPHVQHGLDDVRKIKILTFNHHTKNLLLEFIRITHLAANIC